MYPCNAKNLVAFHEELPPPPPPHRACEVYQSSLLHQKFNTRRRNNHFRWQKRERAKKEEIILRWVKQRLQLLQIPYGVFWCWCNCIGKFVRTNDSWRKSSLTYTISDEHTSPRPLPTLDLPHPLTLKQLSEYISRKRIHGWDDTEIEKWWRDLYGKIRDFQKVLKWRIKKAMKNIYSMRTAQFFLPRWS